MRPWHQARQSKKKKKENIEKFRNEIEVGNILRLKSHKESETNLDCN